VPPLLCRVRFDYDEMKWQSFSRVAEAPEQFTFYSARQELLTFRRMVRRHIADNELLHD
jgi:hypothetical protein